MPVTAALERPRQGFDHEFETNLGYLVRLCQKTSNLLYFVEEQLRQIGFKRSQTLFSVAYMLLIGGKKSQLPDLLTPWKPSLDMYMDK